MRRPLSAHTVDGPVLQLKEEKTVAKSNIESTQLRFFMIKQLN